MTKHRFWGSKKAKIILGVLIVLIALRVALPYIILHYANKTLAEMNGYTGHIRDIDVALYRGAYTIDSFYINKIEDKTGRQTEFLSARTIDLSLEWHALFKGSLAGELIFERPMIRFTENKVELKEVTKDTSDFRQLLHDFMPIQVNRCEIRNGKLQYIDNTITPKLDLAITDMDGIATNLRNAYSSEEILPASIELNGKVYEGNMTLSMKLNPLAEKPAFDMNSKVENTNLVKLNDLFKAYGGVDVNKGTFNMYVEAVTKDGKFEGYVKPLITDLDVLSWNGQDKHDNFFQKIWEGIVGGGAQLFKNQKKDQLATKISFKGDLDNPNANIWETIVLVFQNAFVRALKPAIDNQIDLKHLSEDKKEEKKGFLGKLFGKD